LLRGRCHLVFVDRRVALHETRVVGRERTLMLVFLEVVLDILLRVLPRQVISHCGLLLDSDSYGLLGRGKRVLNDAHGVGCRRHTVSVPSAALVVLREGVAEGILGFAASGQGYRLRF